MSFTTTTTTTNNKRAGWAGFLQIFCTPLVFNQKSIRGAEPTADITIRLSDEKPATVQDERVVATIIYEKPLPQPRPSTAPGAMCQAPAKFEGPKRQNSLMRKFGGRQTARLEQEPISEVAPFFLYTPPVEPRRCHKRWSSVSIAPQDVNGHLRSRTKGEDMVETAVITIGLMTEGPDKPRSLDRSTSAPTPPKPHIYNCARSGTMNSTPSRARTPPFPKPKMQDIPLPPPLPPIFKTIPCKRNSLSSVSNWVRFKVDDTHLHTGTHPITVKAAVAECLTDSPYYNVSTTSVNTLGQEGGHGIMSSWYIHSKDMEDVEEDHCKRQTMFLGNEVYPPLSGTAPAA